MARKSVGFALRDTLLAVYASVHGPRTWRSLKLAVDTGATYTMLPPDILFDIGINPTKATRTLEVSTANGLLVVPVLRIPLLKCLGITVRDVEVLAHHLPQESPVEGLLGLNVLAHFVPFQTFHSAIRPFAA